MSGGLMTFGDAIKAFRRGVHQFPSAWRGLVVASTLTQARFAFDEAQRMLEGGSLPIVKVSHTEHKIDVAKNGVLMFRVVHDLASAQLTAGLTVTHIIALGAMDEKVKSYLNSHLRSPYVDAKYLRWDEATL